MPDFMKQLKQLQNKQNQISAGNTSDPSISLFEEPITGTKAERLKKEAERARQKDPLSYADPSGGMFIGNPEMQDEYTNQRVNEMSMGGMDKIVNKEEAVEGTWSPDLVHRDFLEDFGESILYGVGKQLSRVGDQFQGIGVVSGINAYEKNPISEFLNELGEDIMANHVRYIPEDVLNPEFSFKTYMNPKFWAIHGGEFIPQLVEIIGTIALTKGIGSGLNRAVGSQLAKKSSSELAKMGVRGTTEAAFKGAKGTVEFGKGKGLVGKMLTDKGMTKGFRNLVEGAVGGGLMNLQVSLANAGEIYNTYKDLTDENGNSLFSKEDLSNMASSAFANNMQYMVVDMLSYGLTFGGAGKLLNGSLKGISKVKKTLPTDDVLKKTGGMFLQSTKPLLSQAQKNALNLGFKMGREGIEETFQETFEEWAKMKAYKDHIGTMKGYMGATEDYDNFLDYYFSKESESIRAISFGLGAVAGGVFNINTLINKQADESYKTFVRTENLKNIFEKGTTGHQMKSKFMQQQIAEIVFDGKEDFFADWIKDELDSGRISEEEFDLYESMFDQMLEIREKTENLSIKGKKAMMVNIANEIFFQSEIDRLKAEASEKIKIIKENSTDEKATEEAIKNENNLLLQRIAPLVQMKTIAQENKNNLLSGKPAEAIEYDIKVDEYGNSFFVNKTESNKKDIDEEGDIQTGDEMEAEIKDDKKVPKTKFSDKIKEAIWGVMKGFFSETDQAIEEDQNQENVESEKAKKFLDEKSNEINEKEKLELERNFQEEMDSLSYNKEKNRWETSKRTLPEGLGTKGKAQKFLTDEYMANQKALELPEKTDSAIEEEEKAKKEISKKERKDKISQIEKDYGVDINDNIDGSVDVQIDKTKRIRGKGRANARLEKAKQELRDAGIELREDKKKEISKEETKVDGVTNEEQEFIDEMVSKEEEGTKTLAELEKEEEAEFLGEKAEGAVAEVEAVEEFFGNPEPETELDDDTVIDIEHEEVESKTNEAPKTAQEKATEKVLSLWDKIEKFLNNTKNKLKKSNKTLSEAFASDDDIDLDFSGTSQMIAIAARMDKMFPEQKVRAYKIQNLTNIYGQKVFGFSLAGSMYIDAEKWKQNNTYMHEFSHIYFEMAGGFENEQIQKIINLGLKNKELVDFLLDVYDADIVYETEEGAHIRKEELFFYQNPESGWVVNGYHNLSKEQKDLKIKSLLDSGMIKEIPMDKQPILAEEVFAFTFQETLEPRLNKLFEPKWSEDQQRQREILGKGLWKKIKQSALRDPNYNEKQFLKNLSPEEKVDYENARDYIFEQMKNGITGKDFSPRVKYMKTKESEIRYMKKMSNIQSRISQNIDSYLNVKWQVPSKYISDFSELVENMEDGEYSPFMEMDRLMYIEKAQELINRFGELYNQVLHKRFYLKNKGKDIDYSEAPSLDIDALTVKIWNFIHNSNSSSEFIDMIENSNIGEVKALNKFLDKRDDKLMFLNTYWLLKKNETQLNSIITTIGPNGELQTTNNLNNDERAMYETIYDLVSKRSAHYFTSKVSFKNRKFTPKNIYVDPYTSLVEHLEAIRSGNYTNNDIYSVYKFFFPKGKLEMFKKNQIIIDGKTMDLSQTIVALAKHKDGLLDNSVYKKNDKGKYIYTLKDPIKKLIKGLIATNRFYDAGKMIMNAERNPENTRTVSNFIIREFDQMNADAREMSFAEFHNKYGHISKNFEQGKYGNELLKEIYEKANNNTPVILNTMNGVQNSLTKNNKVMKHLSDKEASINEFIIYINSSYNRGRRNKNYLMEVGRLSDSPRSYLISAPHIDLKKFGEFKDGKFTFTKISNQLKTAYQIYSKMAGKEVNAENFEDFKKKLQKDVDAEIKFIQDNIDAFKNIPLFTQMTENGKMNNTFKYIVTEYAINNFLNGLYFDDIFMPSFNFSNNDKRSKYIVSPGFSFGKNVRIEPLPYLDKTVVDKEGNTFTETDGAQFILREQAEMIERVFGNAMPLGKTYKIVHTGVEKDNPNFRDKSIYDKGHTTILDDEYVEKNPHLKGLYKLMKARLMQYEKANGKIKPEDLTSGKDTAIFIATPVSANKAENYPVQMLDKTKTPTKEGALFDLNTLNEAKNFRNQNTLLNKWYYQNKNFIGLDGSNFMVQQIIDIQKDTSGVSVQMVRFLLSQSGVNGNLKEVEEIQRLLIEAQREELKKYSDIIEKGDATKLRELVFELINKEKVDPRQALHIAQNLSLNTPDLRILAKNTLSNYIRKTGNKFKAPGTIATQKPATWRKQYANENGSFDLEYYGGNKDTGSIPMEVVAPKSVEYAGKRARTYYTIHKLPQDTIIGKDKNRKPIFGSRKASKEEQLDSLKRLAEAESLKRGNTGIGKAFDQKGNHVGWYAKGDTVLLTRIPAHGLQSTGVGEIVDFDTTGASSIQTPYEFALKTTGGDFDGDFVFIQYKGGRNKAWNEFFDKTTALFMSPGLFDEIRMGMDVSSEAKSAIAKVESVLGKKYERPLPHTPAGRRQSHKDTIGAKGLIGITANIHTLMSMMAAYGTQLKHSITINGIEKNSIVDLQDESRTLNSGNNFNIILDNSKDHFSDKLGLNQHTIALGMVLRNMNYSLADIGIILNSKAAKKWVEIMENKENMFTDPLFLDKPGNYVRKSLGIELRDSKMIDMNIKTDKDSLNTDQNSSNIIDLLEYMSRANNQMQSISSMLSGHNKLENNPFILNQQIEDFDSAIDNNNSSNVFLFSDSFKSNPVLKNYYEVNKINREAQAIIDPVYRPDAISVFENITKAVNRKLTKENNKRIHGDMDTYYTAKLLGYNNLDREVFEKIEGNTEESVYSKLSAYINELSSKVVRKRKASNAFDEVITALDSNLLLSQLLNMNLVGNDKFVYLNMAYFQKLSKPQIERVQWEFSQLPTDLKNALILHDLIATGWKGNLTLFPIFDEEFKKSVSDMSDIDALYKNENKMSLNEKTKLEKALISKNPEMLMTTKVNPFLENGSLNPKLSKRIVDNIMKGYPTAFKHDFQENNKPASKIYYFKGFNEAEIGAFKRLRKFEQEDYLKDNALKRTEIMDVDDQSKNIPVIAISNNQEYVSGYDRNSNIPNQKDQFKSFHKNDFLKNLESFLPKENPSKIIREMKDDFWNYTGRLSEKEYENVMEYENSVTDIQKEIAYGFYEKHRNIAEGLYRDKINEETVKNMTDEELKDKYLEYGDIDKYAYSVILTPIMLELTNRSAIEQAKLIKERSGITVSRSNDDIGPLKSWFMTNNVPSGHPEVQAMVRKMEVEYKKFIKEKNIIVSKINNATDDLYKEKFGYGVTGGSLKERIKRIFNYFFSNKESFYNTLYGNLVETEIIKTKDGEVKNFKYKSEEEIERLKSENKISEAEYNFYKVTREVTKGAENNLDNKAKRKDYIPHTAPSNLEILSRRGLLGLMLNSRNIDESVGDVVLNFKNPETGKVEKTKFSDIHNIYLALSQGDRKGLSETRDYLLLKRKAIKLYNQGINEDGSKLELSNMTLGTTVSGRIMNRFLNRRSNYANEFHSLDLNKAFVDYITSTLFVNGNENFQGFKKMLPLVDGVLAFTDSKGQKNLNKYVDTVWKGYMLERKKKESLPSTATQKALGLESDKVIDFLTKSSLLYWLGWKGLAIGGGLYVTGNVLIGKYNNIKNEGTGAWAKGEKRFWLGKTGKFDIANPFKGVKESNEILKRIGFLDINVYDDVNVEAKTSFEKSMTDLALFPMAKSERWIQGAHFLGLLTDEEWDSILRGENLPLHRLTELENEVKNQHGKGYQATDQRMIQMYSMGKMFMQFSRYIPTMFYDRFAKEDINIYGQKHMGSYTAFWKTIQRAAIGEMNPLEFQKYRRNLDPTERKRLDSALIGFGIMTAATIVNVFLPNAATTGLIKDANVVTDIDRLSYKFTPPAYNMVSNVMNF